jgi:ATP phosphoribosyltransferase regulatory subunit
MKNSNKKIALLPKGINDLLEIKSFQESFLSQSLMDIFKLNGYKKISPPLIEFEENYTLFLDTTNKQNIFRITDPISNKPMYIRNDITPQIARIAASKLYESDNIIRLSYIGDVLRPKGSQLHPERQIKQAGIELYGAPNVSGAIEVISTGIQALTRVNITNLIIDITMPNLANLILHNANLNEETIKNAKSYLKVKNINKIKTIPNCGKILSEIADSAGENERALKVLYKISLPPKAKKLVKEISSICDKLKIIHPNVKITIDPIENRGFNYYSGIGFAIFSTNIKRELGFGGEYTIELNEKKQTGMGLSILFDGLLRATNVKDNQKRIFIPYKHNSSILPELREKGWITIINHYKKTNIIEEAKKYKCSYILNGKNIEKL